MRTRFGRVGRVAEKSTKGDPAKIYRSIYIYIALLDLRSILVGGLSIVSIAAKNGLSGLALKQS